MKKFYTYITLTAMLFFYSPNCMAAEIITKTIDGICYHIWQGLSTEEDYAWVTSPEKGRYSGEVNIPASINYEGKKYFVKKIGYLAFFSATVSKVTLPNTIRAIETNAFTCRTLSELKIPSSVQEIDKSAFSDCSLSLIIETNYDIKWSEALNGLNETSTIYAHQSQLKKHWFFFQRTKI